jgi:predicted metal-binding membrane protein
MWSEVHEVILRRERIVVLSGLAAITALSWGYVVSLASDMHTMNMGDMGTQMTLPRMQAWGVAEFTLTFGMWAVMMVAMMTPSAAPIILMFTAVNRRRRKREVSYVPTSVFLAGYLVVWAAFSAIATAAQWGLHAASLLSPMMASTSPVLNEWREGRWGAFLMGLKHGGYCVGCCWSLMALLFVAGIMNLLWVAAIAGFILLEKVAPVGDRLGRVAGVVLVGWGAWMVAGVL